VDEKTYNEIIKPFGSYDRFKKRLEDIAAGIEFLKRTGKDPLEISFQLYEIWEKEYLKLYNNDVKKAREDLIREWRRKLRSLKIS
jgi:hypothetical protein